MDQPTGSMTPRQPRTFIFRGNAVAAGGYLTKHKGVPVELGRRRPTVHGESNLPMIGGISHSLVEKPDLPFAEFISYDQCSTIAEGLADAKSATTSLHSSVRNVRVTTSPSPSDAVPDLRSISFQAATLSISARSTYPEDGGPLFQLLDPPVTDGMSLVLTSLQGAQVVVPLRLEYDRAFLSPGKTGDLVARFPRTAEGYVYCSFVTKIFRGDREIPGNVLVEKGLGTVVFGTAIMDSYSLRVDLVRIKMGSDPEGRADFAGACSNGIWS